MAMRTGISIITLGVDDLPRAAAFYAAGLGFDRVSFASDRIAFFDAGGVQLALFPWDELAKDATVYAAGSGFRGVTLARNVDSSAEVRAILERAIGAGAVLVKAVGPVFWGGYSGYFADPDGHLWEIACGSAEYARERRDD
jgi:uncharacterized protein